VTLPADVAWPLARLGEALEATARRAGLAPRACDRAPSPPEGVSPAVLARWVEDAAAWLGVEVEPVTTSYADMDATIARAAPALLRVRGAPFYLAVVAGGVRRITLLSPSEALVRACVEDVALALAGPLEEKAGPEADALLARAAVPEGRREAARRALLAARLGMEQLDGSFLLGPPASAGLRERAQRAGLGCRLRLFVAASAASYAMLLSAWSLVGRGALAGRVDRGWLAAWGLLLCTQVPLRILTSWVGGRLSIDAGALVKQRLLAGALELEPDAVRGSGAGRLFGRVIESEALETLALGGGLAGLTAIVELGFAALVLALGAAPAAHLTVLAAWLAVAAVLGVRYFRARERWTGQRLAMTHDLVERMVGHRTLLAQEAPERWHDGEDGAVAGYLEASTEMDRLSTLLLGLVPRGFLLLGIALLAPAFAADAAFVGPLAVSLGGILLAERAWARLAAGVADLAGAAIAWKTAAPLLAAADRAPRPPHPDVFAPPVTEPSETGEAAAQLFRTHPEAAPIVVDAHELTFRRPGRAAPILAGASLTIRLGDRVLLEGPSGAGKSTLAALLAGLREAETGLLLVGGFDRHTLGASGFRRRVVAAPQFHDNHVVAASFAFNMLMGRAWPPGPADLRLAEEICRDLDLGPLLDRMPGGLFQMVGETGWQLSHGEKSRLYIARALLQDADLVVLDESFGALDPETLEHAMACVLRRARAVLVIAHP
jgi:ATP-binding cassette subfamily B protein